jgi:mono/diheme cytochrome c family protein
MHPRLHGLMALMVAIPFAAAGQTSAALGQADFQDNCASCHGKKGLGDGPLSSWLVKPPADLSTLAQRHGGQFEDALIAELIDGRWSGDGGPHGSRDMPVWGQVFKQRAMMRPGDSARTAEWSAQDRIQSLLMYLKTLQTPSTVTPSTAP